MCLGSLSGGSPDTSRRGRLGAEICCEESFRGGSGQETGVIQQEVGRVAGPQEVRVVCWGQESSQGLTCMVLKAT